MKHFPQIFYFFLLLFISGCKSDKPDIIVYDVKPFNKKVDDIEVVKNPQKAETYYIDSIYQYEYRTGESGSYQYHYQVIGQDLKGQKFAGEVDMEGKYGVGKLSNNTKIEAEWIDKGKILAKDEHGNVYELIVE